MAVTQAIFGINVAVYIAMVLAGVSMLDNPAGQDLIRFGANYGPSTISGEWWRLLTCVFVHGGLLHILFNMWCLWDLGRLAESVYGHWTFAAVYLITGLSSSLMSLAWNPAVLSVGASGAIFGIAGALIASFYLGEFSLPRAAITGTLRSVVMFVGFNLFFGAAIARTDNAAHIGGLLMGLLLGALIAKVAPLHDDVPRRVGVLLVGAVLVYGGVAWLRHSHAYILHTQMGHDLLIESKTDQAIAEFQTATRQRPDYFPAHYELARAYWLKHDFAGAESELKRVLEQDPQNEQAYYYLGLAYLEQNRPQPARETYERLLQMNPKSADAHFGLGAVAAAEKKYSEALDEFKLTAKLDPSYDTIDQETGRVQLQLRLYDDAIASLLKQKAESDSPETENALASAYEAKGMHGAAVVAAQRAKEFQDRR